MTFAKHLRLLTAHYISNPNILYLRDGEVILYRPSSSPLYQCRFKLAGGSWCRVSSRKASVESAVGVACEMYDEIRFRQRLGLAHDFAHIADATIDKLRKEMDLGRGKSVYHSYITCIEKYFIPYFADKQLEEFTHSDIVEFELWRNRQMAKLPKVRTLNNFASAWSRLCGIAIGRGWISERVTIPKLSTVGLKSIARPAFSREEIERLPLYMVKWSSEGRLAVEREMRPQLRDYVEMLL